MLAILLSTFCESRFRLALNDLTTWSEFSFSAFSKSLGVMTGIQATAGGATAATGGATAVPGREVSIRVLSLAAWVGAGALGILMGAGPAGSVVSIMVSLDWVSVGCGGSLHLVVTCVSLFSGMGTHILRFQQGQPMGGASY